MDEDLHNNDVDMNPDEDADSPTEGDSTSEDNSTQNHLQEWVINTDTNIGTPGEIPPTPTPPSEPERIIQVDIPIKRRWTITNYDPTYLRQLYEKGGVFYVVYEDGTEDECEYTDVVNPFSITQSRIVMEVDEITQANNQHFWYDDNGAHVTDETRYSWEENASLNFSDLSDNNNHNNLLMNSYGLVIRRALKNLAAFSKSAATFYDGDGNEASNMLAMFGKDGVQLGSLEKSRIVLNSNGFSYFSETDVNLFNLSINTASDETIYAANNELISHIANSTTNLDLSQLSFDIIHTAYRIMRLWPPYKDTRIIIHILPDTSTSAASEDISFVYGEKTDGWVDWTHGQYRYDGENTIDIFSTIGMYISINLSKRMSISKFNFGDCIPEGDYSFAEGHLTRAIGNYSHAEGMNTIAYGARSHVEGYATSTTGDMSHAEGRNSSASGDHSHAEGRETFAEGLTSHAEGQGSHSIGECSHAEGGFTETTRNGTYSHVQNLGTISDGECQTIIGKYNKIDGTLPFIIGNGLSHYERSNCFEIDWNGAIDFGPQAISRNTNATLVMKNRSAQMDYGGFYICDKNVNTNDYVVRQHIRETANNGVRWYRTEISRTINNNRAYNVFSIGLDSTNKAIYGVSNPSAFRAAINAVDSNRLSIVEYTDPRFIIYGTSGTAIEFLYNPTTKNLAVRGYDGTSWTNYKPIINLA